MRYFVVISNRIWTDEFRNLFPVQRLYVEHLDVNKYFEIDITREILLNVEVNS